MLTIILTIVGLVAALLAFGFFRSADHRNITLDNEVTINASMDEVFDLVRYLENFPRWSPFLAQDPDQQYEVRGVDGKPGATFHWNGRGGKDVGFQEIITVEDAKYIEMRCDIQKPFVAHPTFAYTFKQTPQGVRVSQHFNVKSGAVDALFMWAFGARKEMDSTNQQGLDLLKQAAEKTP
ncbi:MAG: SRPBCC family protein [Bacteroidota bacterium]